MPAWITSLLRELAPVPKRPAASRIRTSRPRSASSRATASPTTPAPTTITSALSIRRQCSGLPPPGGVAAHALRDRKSTRLNSSHDQISYAVFCLKKKKNKDKKYQVTVVANTIEWLQI